MAPEFEYDRGSFLNALRKQREAYETALFRISTIDTTWILECDNAPITWTTVKRKFVTSKCTPLHAPSFINQEAAMNAAKLMKNAQGQQAEAVLLKHSLEKQIAQIDEMLGDEVGKVGVRLC